MQHFYRIALFVWAFSSSLVLYGQSPQTNKTRHPIMPKKAPTTVGYSSSASEPKKNSLLNSPQSSFNLPQASDAVAIERNCFSVEAEQLLQKKFPNRLNTESFEQQLAKQMSFARRNADDQTVYQIPTIVHVVHHGQPIGTGSNITQEQVMSQFEVLNEDFRRLGAGQNDHPDGADIHIEFVPVLVDPQGNPLEEPGIDRVFGYSAYYEYFNTESELKPNTIWDPNRYFNIWVVTFGGSFSGLLGYAQFPAFSGLEGLNDDGFEFTDGVVIGYQFFGRTGNVIAPFDMGRTTTHEVGHWLGLRHIWGDGDCSVDDFCADTPNANGPNHSCEFRDSCTEDDKPDMIENYMDYSDDACMSVFTNDQRARIRTVLAVSPRRNSLIACQQAPAAVLGENTAELGRNWYQYTATEAQVITLSTLNMTGQDTKVSLYSACNDLPIQTSDNALGTLQSMLSIELAAGETVKILWEKDEWSDPYNWLITSSAGIQGEACGVAAIASVGDNVLPATELSTYWYSYTSASNNQKVSIEVTGRTFSVFGNTCEQLKLLKNELSETILYDVNANETLYIAFDAVGGDFTWNLSTENSREGESCSSAVVAQEGSNIIPYTAPYEYWYSHTMPEDGILRIQTAKRPQGFMSVSVYKSCDGGSRIAQGEGEEFILEDIHLKEGETVKIKWDGATASTDFEWTLESASYTNGEVCAVAKEAELGTNHTDAAPQWFKYTTTKTTNLKISAVGLSEVDTHLMIKRECDGPVTHDNDNHNTSEESSIQSELVLFGLAPGETVYILWAEKWSYEGFDWVIEELDPIQGDNCTTAKQAVLGTNTVSFNQEHTYFGEIFWTKYTVPGTITGKKLVAYADEPIEGAIYYTDNCESFQFIEGGRGKMEAYDLPAGLEIVIIWDARDLSRNFTWNLSIESIQQGEFCTNPRTAVEGVNTSPFSPIWYEYTMTEDANLKISSVELTDFQTYLYVLKGCSDSDILYTNDVSDQHLPGEALIVGLKAGDKIKIFWPNDYPYTEFSWSLEEVPLKQGDTCENPLVAEYGLNYAEYATKWFTYTVTDTEPLKISSLGLTRTNTLLKVYDACGGNLLAESNDTFVLADFFVYYQSEVVLENLEVGQELLIKWAGDYSYAPFYWSITDTNPLQGDSCDDPLMAVEGRNNPMKPSPSWFTFTMPEATTLTLSSLYHSGDDTFVEVYDACDGNLLGASYDVYDGQSMLQLDNLQAGQTVLIHWGVSPMVLLNFEWELILGTPETGAFCQVAKEAVLGNNSTPPYLHENSINYATRYWFSFTMPESNKKLRISHDSGGAVEVWNGCVTEGYGWENSLAFTADDQLELLDLQEGDQIYISFMHFENEGDGSKNGFDWQLEVVDPEAGDTCGEPELAFPGINTTHVTATWYEYTLPSEGNVRISSLGVTNSDTYLRVYDACNGTLLAESDNVFDGLFHLQSEVLLEDMEAGSTIYIRWSQSWEAFRVGFEWSLTVEGVENQAPVWNDVFLNMASAPSNGKVLATLAAQDADSEVLHYRITEGNEQGAFALDAETGVLSISDASQIPFEDGTITLTVSVSDGLISVEGKVFLDIITALPQALDTDVRVYPNPAQDKFYLAYGAETVVEACYLIDLRGNVVKEIPAKTKEVSLADCKPGIYLVKVQTNKGVKTFKLSVVN